MSWATAWHRYRWRSAALLGSLALLLVVNAFARMSVQALHDASEDYVLLERIRVVEVVSERMVRDAGDYHAHAPRNYTDYARDTRIYFSQLQQDLAELDRTIGALAAGSASAEADAVHDASAALQAQWTAFLSRLRAELGPKPDEPRLEWGTQHIVDRSRELRGAIDWLAGSAVSRVERRLHEAQFMISRAMPAAVVVVFLALAAVIIALGRRLACTVASCRDLIHGRFGAPPHYRGEDDFSAVDHGIAAASERVAMVLNLLDGMQRSRSLPALVDGFRSAVASAMPIDWVGLYYVDRRDGMATRRTVSGTATECAETFRLATAPQAPWITPAVFNGLPDSGWAGPEQQLVQSGGLWMPSSDTEGYLMLLGSRARHGWGEADRALLEQLAPLFGHGLEKSELTERLLVATVTGLARLAESRDPETGNHLLRMSEFSRLIAIGLRRLGGEEAAAISDSFIEDIHRFAPMHDIGKVGVPDAILRKPGPLDPAELAEMRRHPLIGGEVLRLCREQLPQMDGVLFQLAIDIAEAHHEKFDGSGYPHGLRGKEIPLAGRIIAVADVLDALASRRPYKEPWPMARVWQHLLDAKGGHFDPAVVAAALSMRAEIEQVQAHYGHV